MLATAIQSAGAQFRRNATRAWEALGRTLDAGSRPVDAGGEVVGSSEVRPPTKRILQLLDEHDGRIEQADVVSALDLSPATVSRKLAALESEGRVVRYRVGRGKVVCRPDCVPEAARSPRRT